MLSHFVFLPIYQLTIKAILKQYLNFTISLHMLKTLDREWDMQINIYKELWNALVKNDKGVWSIIVIIGGGGTNANIQFFNT